MQEKINNFQNEIQQLNEEAEKNKKSYITNRRNDEYKQDPIMKHIKKIIKYLFFINYNIIKLMSFVSIQSNSFQKSCMKLLQIVFVEESFSCKKSQIDEKKNK